MKNRLKPVKKKRGSSNNPWIVIKRPGKTPGNEKTSKRRKERKKRKVRGGGTQKIVV